MTSSYLFSDFDMRYILNLIYIPRQITNDRYS